MINNVTITGRLTKDVDLRYTQSGTAVASFTLAVNRQFKKEGQPDVDFINCVMWAKSAETLANHTSKGSLIGVTGRLQVRNYDNKEGVKVYVTEVVAENFTFLESKKDQAEQQQGKPKDKFSNSSQIDVSDTDLPF